MNTMRCDGAILMWSLSEFSYLSVIKDGLEALEYDKKMLPKARTYAAALKDALYEVCGSKTTLIRPLKSEGGVEGFTVVEETRDTDYNIYKAGLVAKVTPEPKILLSPFDERAQPITDQFNRQMGFIRPASITTSLTSIIGQLGGTALRPNGCVYWIPEYSLGKWLMVCEVVRAAGYNGQNAMHIIRHELDPDAVQAVQDAIIVEIKTAVKKIGEEIMGQELGERALESRKQQAYDLREKIGQYEALLSVGLGQLHKAVDETEIAIAQATLIASTSQQVA